MTQRYADAVVYGDTPEEIEAEAIAAARAELGDVPLEVVPGYQVSEVADAPLNQQAAAGKRYVASPHVEIVS